MSVTVRKYVHENKNTGARVDGWEVDIRFKWADGAMFRRRFRAPVKTELQAERWGSDLERRIYSSGPAGALARSKRAQVTPASPTTTKGGIPTLAEFWPKFITGHCKANRHKPSSIERKESAYRTWLKPLAAKRLDEIGAADIVALKGKLADSSAKSANNVLTALSACLKFAGPDGLRRSEGLAIISHVPRIRLLPVDSDDVPEWYEEPELQRIVRAAFELGPMPHALVLLAGDAGLRKAEIASLKWTDLDVKRHNVHVQRSIWEGPGGQRFETTPKGGRGRTLDMTSALHAALTSLPRHVGKDRVLYFADGSQLSDRKVQLLYSRVQKRAGLPVTGGIHRLRHTFVTRLAANGAPAVTIQKLAGHASITTTMKYMHVAPANLTSAIRLLDSAASGERLENAFLTPKTA